ncbi:DUF2442 domain-containing protein [Nitrospira moscoviensis]|uniref:DUF2442 domain-containing protein n=1 Tax=Nitrospira moscoviensis TaxID=42253 RepID=A0A0K2G8H6_NITMO|nr:DUF2442 domain-containing protein [Nitrospira moscoviensis]ALA57263.1 hypothetical protein NITMOv2_0828 [Nitrospira moscoviensis]
MKSATLGKRTSDAEVTNISRHGFWLLLADEELFIPFKEFPWFKDASVSEILKVEWPHPDHLYWPDLDVDVAVESIRHPEKFPLLSKQPRRTKRSASRGRSRC